MDQFRVKLSSREQLHDEIHGVRCLEDLVQFHNVGVVQSGQNQGLLEQPIALLEVVSEKIDALHRKARACFPAS